MPRTGYKKYLRRIEVYTSGTGEPLLDQPTGESEVNSEFLADGTTADPNYIADVLACSECTVTDDILPSDPTGLHATGIGDNSFTLNWTASTDTGGNCNSGIDFYEILTGGILYAVTAGEETSKYLSGLTTGSTRSWVVRAVDKANNRSASSTPLSVTQTGDGQAPTTPANLTATQLALDLQVDLAWDASTDNVGVTSYIIDRKVDSSSWVVGWHTLTGTPPAHAYSDTSVVGSTTYSYRVSAKDAAGNESLDSSVATETVNTHP